jgi:hypothetical protein
MTTLDEKICEQLSAWMDGELPADEARFFERRLANEPELRARWERMQLAASVLKGQPLRPMPATLAVNIAAAIAKPDVAERTRRPWLGWAVAASVALLAVIVVPPFLGGGQSPGPVIAQSSNDPAALVDEPVFVPSPSSADLVASETGTDIAPPRNPDSPPVAPRIGSSPVVAASRASNGAQSPADFPLTAANDGKAWPRSPLSASGNDPALEAYLIRHNQMMGDDGLSGFVPYVDVVTNESPAADAGGEGEGTR